MQVRTLSDLTKIDAERLFRSPEFGQVITGYLSTVPDEYTSHLSFIANNCPVCGGVPDEANRVLLNLSVDFENVKNLGVIVWAHNECFDVLAFCDQNPPIPW